MCNIDAHYRGYEDIAPNRLITDEIYELKRFFFYFVGGGGQELWCIIHGFVYWSW